MRFSKQGEERCKHKFTWGKDGPELPAVDDYKYLGVWVHKHMDWTKHFVKKAKAHAAAKAHCNALFKEVHMPPELKLIMFKSKIDPQDKYAMEVTDPTKETIDKINMRQMKAVKTAL